MLGRKCIWHLCAWHFRWGRRCAGNLRSACREKGDYTSDLEQVDFAAFKETQYNLLAEGLRAHLDMEKIYKILETGI